MSEKHSPTPWSNEARHVYDSEGNHIFSAYSTAVAQSIVRCVNAHDELVAALEDLISFVEPALESGVRIPGLATVNLAKAALSKAKE